MANKKNELILQTLATGGKGQYRPQDVCKAFQAAGAAVEDTPKGVKITLGDQSVKIVSGNRQIMAAKVRPEVKALAAQALGLSAQPA